MKTEQEAGIRAEQRKFLSTEEMKKFSLETSSSELISLTEFQSILEEVGSCDHREEPMIREMRKETVAVRDEVSTQYREILTTQSIQNTLAKPKEKLYEDIRPPAKDVEGLSHESVCPTEIKNDLATPSPSSQSATHSPPSQSATASPPSQSPTTSPLRQSPKPILPSQSPTPSPPSQSPTPSPLSQSLTASLLSQSLTASPRSQSPTPSPPSQSLTASPPSQSPTPIPPSRSLTPSPPSRSLIASPPSQSLTPSPPSHSATPSQSIPKREVLIAETTAEHTVPITSGREDISLEKTISEGEEVNQLHVSPPTVETITALPVEDLIPFRKLSTHDNTAVKIAQTTKMVLQTKQVDSVGHGQALKKPMSKKEKASQNKSYSTVKTGPSPSETLDSPQLPVPPTSTKTLEEVVLHTKEANNIVEPSKTSGSSEDIPAVLQTSPQHRVAVTKLSPPKQVLSQKDEEHQSLPARETQSKDELRAVSSKQESPKEQQHHTPKSSPTSFPQRQDSQKTKQLKNIEEPISVRGIL